MFLHTTLFLIVQVFCAFASASQINLTSLFGPHLSPGAEIILPSNPAYPNDTERWTIWEAPSYIGAIKPATESDVQEIIQIATKNDIPFLATGPNHGFSLEFGSVKNAINIDLNNFNTVEVDTAENRLTIGGAVIFDQIFQPLYAAGKEIQTGNAACVGMVGATLGGGIGPLQGLHGLIIDALESVRLVTAAGDLITVSATENPDLFWALRGAGANFGIITSANYTVYDATNGGQVLNADFLYPASANHSVFELIASFDESVPAPLAFQVVLAFNQTSKQPELLANFIYFGTEAEAQPYLEKFAAIPPLLSANETVPWPQLDSVTSFGEANVAACTHNIYANIYSIGLNQTDVPTFETYLTDFVAFATANSEYAGTLTIQRQSNAVSLSAPPGSGVYPWRNIKTQLLFTNTELNSSINAAVDAFQQKARVKFQATSGFPEEEVYINYSHGDEGPAVWYGEDNLPRLESLKALWDPYNVFPGGHAIPV